MMPPLVKVRLQILLLCVAASSALAGASPHRIAADAAGKSLQLPVAGEVTLLVFLQPGQAHSDQAAAEVARQLASTPAIKVVGIVSGPAAWQRAAIIMQWPWPLLTDEDYAASGTFDVHVWPTALLFDAAGRPVARLPGFPQSFAARLAAYTAFATGKLTQAQLDAELTQLHLVQDSADQKAARHLLLAEQFLAGRRLADAAQQLRQAQDLAPAADPVRLRLVRAELRLGESKAADDLLAAIDGAAVPAAEMELLRGWTALAQGRWEEARSSLLQAKQDGAQPAEVEYHLGCLYAHDGDYQRAADSFRQAFQAASRPPATQPSR